MGKLDKLRDELLRAGAFMPTDRIKKIFKEVDTHAEEREAIVQIIKNKKVPHRKREELKRLLDSGAFSKTELVVDDKEADKLDREVGDRIESAIKKGTLKRYDPKKDSQALEWKRKTQGL